MADLPQLIQPDLIGAYIRGRMGRLAVDNAQQENTAGGLKIDQLRMALAQQQKMNTLVDQISGGQQQGAQTGGIQNGPQGDVQQAPQGSQPGDLPSINPSTYMALDLLQGRDPLASAQKAQDYQIKQRQLRAQGPMALAETVSTSANADVIVKNNPSLQQQWIQLAPQLGLDPFKDLTPENARRVATFGYNQLAGGANLPLKPMPNMVQTEKGPLGSEYQVDPLTGKKTQTRGEESLHPVIGQDGKPTLLPASEAAGKSPYNQSIFGATNIGDDTKEMAYQFAKANGGKLPPFLNSRGDAAKSEIANYIAQRAKAEGDTATSIVAQGQATEAAKAVVKDFTSGKTSQIINGLNTSIKHIQVLNPLIDALDNGDTKLLNKAQNFFKDQFGQTAPNDFNATRDFVAGEISKAVLPGGGGEREREEISKAASAASSPAVLKSIVSKWEELLAGKTDALRNQWDVGTNGTQGSFDKFLLPDTKKALKTDSAHPPEIQSLLDKYK